MTGSDDKAGTVQGGGINAAELRNREKDALSGTGGSSGGGTRAGSGDSGDAMGKGRLAEMKKTAEGRGGEALGSGAGRADAGAGTPRDKGDLGGGGSR